MVLRKHLIGLRIKNFITNDLERIVSIEFEGFDDVDDIITKKLIVELMGKHCNIQLLDDSNTIIDSLRHVGKAIPHNKYQKPQNLKENFLNLTSFEDFKKISSNKNFADLFIGFSNSFVNNVLTLTNNDTKKTYEYFNNIISSIDSFSLKFELLYNDDGKIKDYVLVQSNTCNNSFSLNYFIDDFYYKKETKNTFETYRNSILKLILDTLKKYNKRLENINKKLENCDNMDIYRLYGELITSNLYRLPKNNTNKIELENYYDNNNLISIPLDSRYSPSENAKRFFKKYHKLKNELEIVSIQKKETLEELNYIESIIYELENATTIDELSLIFDEISENVIFKSTASKYKGNKKSKIRKSQLTNNKKTNFNPLKYIIDDYTLLVGRNNKENDFLTLKYAKKTDIWFHTKDIHGSHAVLCITNKPLPDENLLLKCAEITAHHSKAINSSNVPVDYCYVKYVKKPYGAKPGMVIYTNQKTLYVTPSDIKQTRPL